MRALATSFLAFLLSGFTGGMTVQILAESTNAGEEFILAFMAAALFTFMATAVFFVTQLVQNPVFWTGRIALIALVLLVAAFLALSAWTLAIPADRRTGGDFRIIGGLILPGIVIVATQWLFVRWRLVRGLRRPGAV